MEDQMTEPIAEDEATRLRLWQVMIEPKGEYPYDHRRFYQIVVLGKADALAEAMRRYREEIELVSEVTEVEPILIEKIGKNTTRVTDTLRGAWWRGLFRDR